MCRIFCSFLVLSFGVLSIACSPVIHQSKPEPAWLGTRTCTTPPILDPQNWVCAVGQHQLLGPNQEAFAWTQAELDGRLRIAQEAKTFLIDYLEKLAGQKTTDPKERARYADLRIQITEGHTKVILKGAGTKDSHMKPKQVYVLMAITKADLAKSMSLPVP
jgi:hypothetical protein